MPVPTTREVVPGALVNIVLKADQRTGRTVQGAVAQLLTRGNHPRGIKVRLADGRVGRVQSMAGDAALAGPLDQLGGEPEMIFGPAPAGFPQGRRGGRRHYTDMRQEPPPPSTQPVGLDAYIKPSKRRGNRGSKAGNSTIDDANDESSLEAPMQPANAHLRSGQDESICPVCGDFRGDAAALTYHVQTHFDD
ncbi:hypothetical protein MYCTH_2309663 [Thermothelomyces thermophilus ATCC 42464]|uniref:UBZ4-type domain-containing protein n=1 Tax=Thermothelomyces thermophilus (strain ATCC 42464 / BCRC 31852 / DSM 1799) TaxID=573729 RepID=G2QJ87_THET4|nr:uncharacterized protein MYCTH_2309663 [Thermothelomyces thermophilus ATCC 42464]AEO60453.1 hypothetical protein MYCTH_2309663 [Thermothelomyces thermophilus ATCC 42464]